MTSDFTSHPVPTPPRLATRDLRSFTAEGEKRILVAIARRLPGWIGPDHLTALGALSMAGAGLCYRLVQISPLALLGVNLCLFLNWFGDSLDGTVARVREKQRPRYGFFVDHLVDAFGAIFLLGGVASSGLVSPFSALALLIAYLLLQIHIALKSQTTHVFQIAFAGIGGTEARLVLGLLNLAVLLWPGLAAFASLAAWCAAGALVVVVLKNGYETGVLLDREERLLWADRHGRSHPGMLTKLSRSGQVRSLLFAALLLGSGVRDASAQILSLEGGYRGSTSGPSYSFRPPAGPIVGIRVAPVRSGWWSLGAEAFWSPSVTDVLIPEYCTYYLPTGQCVKRLNTVSESAIQAGLSVRFGQLRRPRGFFGEVGLGGFSLTQQDKREFWASSDADHGARWHRNKLIDADSQGAYSEVGPYSRIGVGYQIRLREGGPTALTSLRYRWGTTLGEGSYKRSGFELLLGLGLF